MLKLSLPTPYKHARYRGQVAFGEDDLPSNGNEVVAQKWVAVVSAFYDTALTVINDGIYGSDCCYGEARLSLLRSPGYSTHPVGDRPFLPNDRYSPRMDQGERLYRFWINGGPMDERLAAVERESLVYNEKPMALSFFPQGGGALCGPFATLSDDVIQMTALKQAEDGEGLILRVFNPTAVERNTTISLPDSALDVAFRPYEIRTYRVVGREWRLVNLVEEPILTD